MTETAAPAETRVPATTSKKGTPVSAAELLRLTSELEGSPSDKIAHAAGYYTEVTTTATGEVDVRVTAEDNFNFMRALLAAQGGPVLTPPSRSNRSNNRKPIIKIGKTGNIVVGGRYTAIAGFPFGEDLVSKVLVQAEEGKITIVAASPEDYDNGDDDIDGFDGGDDGGDDEGSDLDT